MKILFNSMYYALVLGTAAVGLLLLTSLLPLEGGVKIKIVKSGSMEPTIKTGSIVIIKPQSSYTIGDIVTFGADTKTQVPTTHRIVDIEGAGAGEKFQTKGDANNAADPSPTSAKDVHGKVLLTVPYAGYLLDFARKPLGFALLVGVPAMLIILEELGKIIREVRRMRTAKRAKQQGVTQSYATQPKIRRIVD